MVSSQDSKRESGECERLSGVTGSNRSKETAHKTVYHFMEHVRKKNQRVLGSVVWMMARIWNYRDKKSLFSIKGIHLSENSKSFLSDLCL